MAYNVKYRFQFESDGNVPYRVDLLEDGYSGTIKKRPLGKAPVIRMQDSGCIRATSCDLVMECQVDGEFVDIYTTDPFQYKVEVQAIEGNTTRTLWRGYVATEIYSEPDIAPPYDVRITATDGLGILKEYNFEPVGELSIRQHICALLNKAGDAAPMFYYATKLSELGGSETAFMDDAHINLDYMAGKSCYDVLVHILTSLRSVLLYRGTHWLIVREVDVQMNSSGVLTVVQCVTDNPYYVPASMTVKMGKSVGQKGVADMWPVGYLTRRVVPAKKSVAVKSIWHYQNGFPKVSENEWNLDGNASFESTGKYYHIGTRSQSFVTAMGNVYYSMTLFRFTVNLKVRVKASAHSVYGTDTDYASYIRIGASWASGSTFYYWSSESGWITDSGAQGERADVKETNNAHDPNACKVVEFILPPIPDDNPGVLAISIVGCLVDIYDIEVLPSTVAGYEDRIAIDNGSRGDAGEIDIMGGRMMNAYYIEKGFYQDIFLSITTSGGVVSTYAITQFSDLITIGKDFMSLAAIAYAREVALPRIEITGKLNHDYDANVGMPVPFIKSHGVWALMKSMNWDMGLEDVDFSAVTLPSAALTVESEEITSIPNE